MAFTKIEDYAELSGTDLSVELSARINDITDNAADRFIQQIEDFIDITYYADYGFNGINNVISNIENKYKNVTDEDTLLLKQQTLNNVKNCYKKAVCYQIMYEMQNGSLWNDSGYNLGTGLVVNPTELLKLGIPQHVHNWMRKGGFANLRRG